MKIEITSQLKVLGWKAPIVIITQHEYSKNNISEINIVVEMLCNINCFERNLVDIENIEILNIFNKFKKGCKVLLGVCENSMKSERHLEIAVLTPQNKILPITQYNEETDSSYVVQRA